MSYYTIQSKSEDGTYYLVNGWDKHKAFWKPLSKYHKDMMFKRASDAKRSRTKLLKVMMGDYVDDEMWLVECKYSEWRDTWVFYPIEILQVGIKGV